jgi:hypothetical protein
MWERYKPPVIVAGVLFLVCVIGGLLGTGVLFNHGGWTGLSVIILIAVIMAVAAFLWSQAHPLARVVPDVLLTTTIACFFTVALVPLISEVAAKGHWKWGPTNPFASGAGEFFSRIWVFYGCALAGAVLGWMITVALGTDYRSKALKRYTQTVSTRPHRSVRR